MREKLMVEKAMDKEIDWHTLPRMPHCDGRVLHKPEECVYCAKSTVLQEERERLGVSNTGHANRKWPCPADKARSSQSLNGWHGNRAFTQEDLDREDKEWEKFREKLKLEDAEVVEQVDTPHSKRGE